MNLSKKRIEELNCVLGVDVSHYQTNVDWKKAYADGIRFAFVKITEGTTGHEDNIYNLKARVLDAQKNGIKCGYYHFARPGNVAEPEADAKEEVANVIAHMGMLPKPNLPLVLDLEAYSTENIWDDKIDHMDRFISTFISEMKLHGISVIYYSYKSFTDVNTKPIFGANPLWIAAYPANPETTLPAIPNGWKEWKIWQFTAKGAIDGYVGDIDLNIMKKDYFNMF